MKVLNKLLLDTHVWIWYATGDTKLSTSSVNKISQAAEAGHLYLSSISVLEVCQLNWCGRFSLALPCREWVEQAILGTKVFLVDLDSRIAVESYALPGEFNKDPAGRIIVATARILEAKLLTRDKSILSYHKQGYVELIKV